MRLIDADALFEQMKRRKEYVGRPSDPVCLVEDAPTIDAVALLKEREPVKPIRINTINDGFSFAYACGKCCYFLPRIGIAAKYCTNCGTAVKWDEAD